MFGLLLREGTGEDGQQIAGYTGLRFGFYHLQKGKLKYNQCLLVAGTKGDNVCGLAHRKHPGDATSLVLCCLLD